MSASARPLRWTRARLLGGGDPPMLTALQLDRYDWWHFRRLGAFVPALAEALAGAPELVAIAFDVYGLLYKPRPKRKVGPLPRRNLETLDALEGTVTLASLREKTVLDEWATVMALPTLMEPHHGASHEETPPAPDELHKSASSALAKVHDGAEAADAVTKLLEESDAWGRNRGALREVPLAELLALAALLDKDPFVRGVLELAGRFSVALRRRPTRGGAGKGRSEVLGVGVGAEIDRLAASERVLFAHPLYRRVVLARALERRALVTEMQGPKSKGRGPIIVLVDTSASMGTERTKLAKALALSLALRAGQTGRPFHLLTFGAPGEIHETSFRTRDDFLRRLYGCIGVAFGGGTDFDGPLRRVCELVQAAPWSTADAIFVTDGVCNVAPDTRKLVSAAKRKTSLEIVAVLLGKGAGLGEVADSSHELDARKAVGPVEDAQTSSLLAQVSRRL